ncbi:MAG: hypothetical protein ACE5OT_01730 [Candidatus Hadarchaeaceae archaeon]
MKQKAGRKIVGNKVAIGLAMVIVFISSFGAYVAVHSSGEDQHDKPQIADEIQAIKLELKSEGKYRCCLNSGLCSYCLLKEGECDCLDELMKGEEICGECLGEWIEGEGHACPMMAAAFDNVYPELWKITETKYIGKPLGPCPLMWG